MLRCCCGGCLTGGRIIGLRRGRAEAGAGQAAPRGGPARAPARARAPGRRVLDSKRRPLLQCRQRRRAARAGSRRRAARAPALKGQRHRAKAGKGLRRRLAAEVAGCRTWEGMGPLLQQAASAKERGASGAAWRRAAASSPAAPSAFARRRMGDGAAARAARVCKAGARGARAPPRGGGGRGGPGCTNARRPPAPRRGAAAGARSRTVHETPGRRAAEAGAARCSGDARRGWGYRVHGPAWAGCGERGRGGSPNGAAARCLSAGPPRAGAGAACSLQKGPAEAAHPHAGATRAPGARQTCVQRAPWAESASDLPRGPHTLVAPGPPAGGRAAGGEEKARQVRQGEGAEDAILKGGRRAPGAWARGARRRRAGAAARPRPAPAAAGALWRSAFAVRAGQCALGVCSLGRPGPEGRCVEKDARAAGRRMRRPPAGVLR
jgi:hypothetical protein